MLIELSTSTKDNRRFWERVEKPKPIYSISESELNKAALMFSIGITKPRINVIKVKAKIANCINTFYMPNNGGAVRLFKDDEGFYIEKLDWNNP